MHARHSVDRTARLLSSSPLFLLFPSHTRRTPMPMRSLARLWLLASLAALACAAPLVAPAGDPEGIVGDAPVFDEGDSPAIDAGSSIDVGSAGFDVASGSGGDSSSGDSSSGAAPQVTSRLLLKLTDEAANAPADVINAVRCLAIPETERSRSRMPLASLYPLSLPHRWREKRRRGASHGADCETGSLGPLNG